MLNNSRFDKIIIGAGLYGLYAALFASCKGQSVLVLECDDEAFKRATYINQARVHNGYHYPRSVSTALKSAHYFERFNKDFDFCINGSFNQIYATSASYSWSSASQFMHFCKVANIPCQELNPHQFFKKGMCDGAFLTKEFTYDAKILKNYFLQKLSEHKTAKIIYNCKISNIQKKSNTYKIITQGASYESPFVLNASYASTNQIIDMLGFEKFKIKYELCEIILCEVNQNLKDYGFTVMDGPFFSIMPFGKSAMHSLTSVTFTPHKSSFDLLPSFACQKNSNGFCNEKNLGNCNDCPAKPKTAFDYMARLSKKYLKDDYDFVYKKSLFSMKPILKASEIDDSRPTVIKKFSSNPTFVSVLSGKINTVYDLDEVLDEQ